MVTLTTLDILYIVLSIFTTIIWTLLAIVLFKVIKILNPVLEIVDYYNQFKSYLASYKAIPLIVKEKIFEIISNFWSKDKENNTETDELNSEKNIKKSPK